MKILITGNAGYIGPVLSRHLRQQHPESTLIGLDMGYFAQCLMGADLLPECYLDCQYFGDLKQVDVAVLEGVDAIVNLAAISNDPMGNSFEEVTYAINYKAAVDLARKAKQAGVRSFVFASSCSVYGCAEEGERKECSTLNPLTVYAKSKVMAETELATLADRSFTVTSLRFATACGMSDRLRLDLVLNDFVAGAVTHKKIVVLSDGSPWRPLINVRDMARAIDWAIQRKADNGAANLIVNVGSNAWNCQVKDLAEAVAGVIPNVEVSINKNAQPDKRSYRVSYDLFEQLASGFQPQSDLKTTIFELKEGLEKAGFSDPQYRDSHFIRLNVLRSLRKKGLLTEQLDWAFKQSRIAVA
jgi:nucleoside-diphosphate-sugar epimerase